MPAATSLLEAELSLLAGESLEDSVPWWWRVWSQLQLLVTAG